jgi:hypothetical protein
MLLLIAARGFSYVTGGRVHCKNVRIFSEDCEITVSAGIDAWPISIFLTAVQQHDKIASSSIFVPFECTDTEDPSQIDVKYTFEMTEDENTFKIAEAGEYAVCSYNCSGPGPTDWSFRIRHTCGWLDEGIYPLAYIPMCEVILYLVLFVPWLVNRLHNRAMALAIHTLVLIALVIHLIGAAVGACIYMLSNFHGTDQRALIVPEVFAMVNDFCILCLCLFFAAGLSISRKKLRPGTIAAIVIDCFTFAAVHSVLVGTWFRDVKSDLSIIILAIGIYITAYVIFLVMNLKLFNASYRILRTHLAIIMECGIDPEGTPTRRKMRMLRRLKHAGLNVFLVFVVSTFLAVWDVAPIWATYLAVMVADFLFFCVACTLCRIRKDMAATYGDDVDVRIVNDSKDKRNLVEWHPGMPLPPLPAAAYRSAQVHEAPPTCEEAALSPGTKDSTDL